MIKRFFSLAMRLIIFAGVFLAVYTGLAVFGPLNPDRLANNRKLDGITSAFLGLTHPPGSQLVSRESRVGLLVGNGNHCDFFVGEIRRFRGPASQLTAHYGSVPVINAADGTPVALTVISFAEAAFSAAHLPHDLDHPTAWGIGEADLRELYLVSAFTSENANGDWRCH